MQVGICLLSKNGYYLREDGSLPIRPSWDKKFLVDLVTGMSTICSQNTFNTLPLSIKEVCPFSYIYIPSEDTRFDLPCQDINLGIATFKENPELMFIVRSKYEADGGKLLRLDNYTKIIDFTKDDGDFEIWKLKTLSN